MDWLLYENILMHNCSALEGGYQTEAERLSPTGLQSRCGQFE